MSVSGGGSSQSQKESGTTAPWAPQQPYLIQGFQAAGNELTNGPRTFYPGQTYAGQSGLTQEGINTAANTARFMDSQVGIARNAANQTLTGDYLKDPSQWASQMHTSPTMNPNAGARAGVATNPSAGVMNPNANVKADVAPNTMADVYNPMADVYNPNAGATSQLATNQNLNVYNPNASTANPYLAQGVNDYLDEVTRSISRSVTPQVQSAYGLSGRSGNSAGAEQAIARGIADAVAPYQFGAMESELGRRFAGGESAAGREFTAGENLAERQFTGGETEADRLQAIREASAGRLYASGENLAGRQFTAGENLADRQFGAGESFAAGLRDASADQASRQYGAGSQYASQVFGAGESQAARAQAEAEAAAQRQYGAGAQYADQAYGAQESAFDRGLSAYDAERQRQMQALGLSPAISDMQYDPARTLMDLGATQEAYAQQPIDEAMARWDFEQSAPMDELAQYMDVIQGNYGSVFSGKSSGSGRQGGFSTMPGGK